MTNNFILMAAMPPTTGHIDLIEFARRLGGETIVLVHTEPDQPFTASRPDALMMHYLREKDVQVFRVEQSDLAQNPKTAPEWDVWRKLYARHGYRPGDRIVSSEAYGVELAKQLSGEFIPYDLGRVINRITATEVRRDPWLMWDYMIPEFRRRLQKRVTIFGAESTGKTLLTEWLEYSAHIETRTIMRSGIAPEWARPYLETAGSDLTEKKMYAIFDAQRAMERVIQEKAANPLTIMDTDAWSTIGYWEAWKKRPAPARWGKFALKSDLYIITPSNIPFEADELRYGGSEREFNDQYWIDFAERNNLPYVVLKSDDRWGRVQEALSYIIPLFEPNPLAYDRHGDLDG